MFRPQKKEIPGLEKVNIIPIMDAVFIFIFFLLFSAEFIKIYEMASDAPVISELPEDKAVEKDPLNFTVKISKSEIQITKSLDNVKVKTIMRTDQVLNMQELKEIALELKKSHPKEDYAIVVPNKNIKYEYIVKVMDAIQQLPNNQKKMQLVVGDKTKEVTKIFSQVVLEPSS